MRISVSIPTYDRSYLLKNTLESILSQSHKPEEIVICDDGSDDNTHEVAMSFDAIPKSFLPIRFEVLLVWGE